MISLHEKFLNNKRIWYWGSLLLLTIYLLPLFIYGGTLEFLAFDNLDSNVVWFKILAKSGKIFSSNHTIIPNMMNGLPRSCYGSEFNTILWLYYFFTPIQAYVINELIIHSVAFFSMYLFLDRYLFKEEGEYRHIYINIGALYFAILPFWPSGGLSIPLMPLVTYALLKIEEGQDSWKLWGVLILLPLYSSFILVYFFYFLIAGIYFIRKLIITRKFNTKLFFALVMVVTLFLLTEYRILLEMFIEKSFISNRTEYFSLVNKTFLEAFRQSHIQFLNGVPHGKGIHFTFILPALLIILMLSLFREKFSKILSLLVIICFLLLYITNVWSILLTQKYSLPAIMLFTIIIIYFQKENRLISILLFIQIIIAYIYGFSFYEKWNIVFESFPAMKMFNFSRFFFISQVLWAIIVALIIKIILKKFEFSKLLILLLVLVQFYIAVNNALFGKNQQLYHLPYNKYYATEQFNEIKQYIGEPQEEYRIISLGIDPAVSLYNGFYTLDGYIVNYPLNYKHEFRKIIQKYLSKDKLHSDLYDGWGSKVYLFDHNVKYSYQNENDIYLNKSSYSDLDLNATQIYNMGGKYLLSSRKIIDEKKIGLHFEKVFNIQDDTLWTIWLYRIVNPKDKKVR